jgi:hypothetical protein
LNEKRTEYVSQITHDNLWITALQQNRKTYDPPVTSRQLCSFHLIEQKSSFFPMLINCAGGADRLFEASNFARRIGNHLANISDAGLDYLATMNGVEDHPHLFHHTIAILHAPTYAAENAAALRQDWPRVPLPAARQQLLACAELGRRVAALLDPETPVRGVTTAPAAALKLLGVPTKVGGGNFSDDDYSVTARWGIAGKGGITMPAKGRVEKRPFDALERAAMGETIALFGETTCDVYLNDRAYWRNVPLSVWEYTLGGYQVLKKWLSYREHALLGRPLTVDEVTYVRDVIRRIAALLLLGPDLDANYAATKADAYEW